MPPDLTFATNSIYSHTMLYHIFTNFNATFVLKIFICTNTLVDIYIYIWSFLYAFTKNKKSIILNLCLLLEHLVQ